MEKISEERIQSILKRKPYLQIFRAASGGETEFSEGPRYLYKSELGVVLGPSGRALSSSRPMEEAERLLPRDREKWTGREIVLILGLGNPVLPSLVLGALKKDQICILIDHRFELARELAFGPLASFLERPGCHLFGGQGMMSVFQMYLESIPAERFRGVRRALHAGSMRDAPEFYSNVEETARNILRAKMSDLLTRFEFERTWLRNTVINTRHLSPSGTRQGQELYSYEGVLRGMPGMVIGAGPSLRHSRQLLEAAKGRVFLLACDTALKAVLRLGIVPDGVCTLDAQKHTIFHFMGVDLANIPLFADLVANPMLFRTAKNCRPIFSNTAKYITHHDGSTIRESTPGTSYAESIHGPIGDVQSGGSVATNAFEMLRFLGCDPIFLLGLDLAYSGGEIHSTGTHHNEKWLTKLNRRMTLEGINRAVFRKRHIRMVPSVTGGETTSDHVMDLYRQWFEDSIPRAGVRVIHLNPEGAAIAAAERLEDPAAFLESLPRIDLSGIPGAPHISFYDHAQNRELYEDLGKEPDEFFEKHSFARALLRKAEVYEARNRDKLGEERTARLMEKAKKDAVRFLRRGLRPYFS
jgi:hypothetical protein